MRPRALWWLPLALLASRAAELDRTDPRAVAGAYLEAVAAADAETALKLTLEDKSMRTLIGFMGQSAQGEAAAWLTALSLLPVNRTPGLRFEAGEVTAADGRLTLAATRTVTTTLQLILVKTEAGEYRVDLRATVLAALPDDVTRSLFAAQLKGLENLPQGMQNAGEQQAWQVHGTLSALVQALGAFAKEKGRYPNFAVWVDELLPYLETKEAAFKCPVHPTEEFSFAFNLDFSEKPATDDWQLKRRQILLASTDDNLPNAVFQPENLKTIKPRYGELNLFATADGNVWHLPAGMSPAELWAAHDQTDACQQRLRRLGEAARKYAEQHDGRLPGRDTWAEEIEPLLNRQGLEGDPFVCPADGAGPCSYALNEAVAGQSLKALVNHPKIPLFVEVEPGARNRCVPAEYTGPGKHLAQWQGTTRISHKCWLDGHVSTETPGAPGAAVEE